MVRTTSGKSTACCDATAWKLMTSCSVLLLCFLSVTPGVSGYSSGAPTSVCSSMIPGNGGSRDMYTDPFTITTSSKTYSPLRLISVSIEPMMDVQIRGFFIQARPANNRTADFRIGSFIASTGTRLECNSGAVTHSYSANRLSVTVSWRAPPIPQGDIVFRATAVRNFQDYYMEFYSDVLSFQMPTTTTTPPPTTITTPPPTTTTTPPTTTTTTPLPTTATTPPPPTTTTAPSPTTTTTPPSTTSTTTPTTTMTTTVVTTVKSSVPHSTSAGISRFTTATAASVTGNVTTPFLIGNTSVLDIQNDDDGSTSKGILVVPSCWTLLALMSIMFYMLNIQVVPLT